MREIVAIAGSSAEENAIEQVLDAGGVTYEIALDAAERGDGDRSCLLSRSYVVDPRFAVDARELLRDAGLSRLIAQP